jgi:hypothetical protein
VVLGVGVLLLLWRETMGSETTGTTWTTRETTGLGVVVRVLVVGVLDTLIVVLAATKTTV